MRTVLGFCRADCCCELIVDRLAQEWDNERQRKRGSEPKSIMKRDTEMKDLTSEAQKVRLQGVGWERCPLAARWAGMACLDSHAGEG